jgi:type I restriction enzyme M protein
MWRAINGEFFLATDEIPVCLWFVARDQRNGRFRDCRSQIQFVDARKLGTMVDRTNRELTDDDIRHIAQVRENLRRLGNGE